MRVLPGDTSISHSTTQWTAVLRGVCAVPVLAGAADCLWAQPKDFAPVPAMVHQLLAPPPAAPEVSPEVTTKLPPVAKPTPAELDVFGKRLDLQLRVWRAWVEARVPLTDQQRNEITARINALVESERTLEAHRSTRLLPFPDDFPYLFHLQGPSLNLRTSLHYTMLQDRLALGILSRGEVEHLNTCGREVVEFRRMAFRELTLTRIDESLGLSNQQLERVRSYLSLIRNHLDAPFHSLNPTARFPSQPVLSLLRPLTKEVFTAGQVKLLGPVTGDQVAADFQLGLGNVDAWRADLRRAANELRDNIYDHHRMQIEQLEALRDVPPGAAERLRMAAKGSAVSLSEDWEAGITTSAEQFAGVMSRHLKINPSVTFGIGGPLPVETVEQHPLWAAELKSFLENSTRKAPAAERLEIRRAARAGAVLVMLDEELWLTPAQREQLLPLVTRVLDQHQPLNPEDENFSLLGELAIPLHRIPPEVWEPILNPVQQEVWKVLAAYFEVQSGEDEVVATSRGLEETLEWKWRVINVVQ